MEKNIDIFWHTTELINDNKNRRLHKLVFVSPDEVKELVKGNLYDDLTLNLNQETDLDTSQQIISKNNPRIKKASEFSVKVNRVYLKSAKVINRL